MSIEVNSSSWTGRGPEFQSSSLEKVEVGAIATLVGYSVLASLAFNAVADPAVAAKCSVTFTGWGALLAYAGTRKLSHSPVT